VAAGKSTRNVVGTAIPYRSFANIGVHGTVRTMTPVTPGVLRK